MTHKRPLTIQKETTNPRYCPYCYESRPTRITETMHPSGGITEVWLCDRGHRKEYETR